MVLCANTLASGLDSGQGWCTSPVPALPLTNPTASPAILSKQKAEAQLDAALAYKPAFLDGYLGEALRLFCLARLIYRLCGCMCLSAKRVQARLPGRLPG